MILNSSQIKKFVEEFFLFGLKQAWACLFGGLLLALIIITTYIPVEEYLGIARYDFLFLSALVIQCSLAAFKLETKEEALVILIFHIVGTIMEVFKTSEGIGSWSYPESSFFHIANVPLFSGFMYASVGSYIARCWGIFDFRFTRYPSFEVTLFLSILIYLNFFTHHYIWDLRIFLFLVVFYLFRKTYIHFKIQKTHRKMPLLIGFLLVTFFIWLAENIGTLGGIWLYPDQVFSWQMVSWAKFGSWFLLMIISFVLVTLAKPIKSMNYSKKL